MSENSPQSPMPNMIETTDCFEAVKTFKSLKNILFGVALICLIITQALFWLEYAGRIDKTGLQCPIAWNAHPPLVIKADTEATRSEPAPSSPAPSGNTEKQDTPIPESSDSRATEALEEAGQSAENLTQEAEQAIQNAVSDARTLEAGPNADISAPGAQAASEQTKPQGFALSWPIVFYLLKTCNMLLMLTITLYPLILLVCLNISLTGRLGGLAHISVAFSRAIIAWALVLPWQKFLFGIHIGAIYTPEELLCGLTDMSFMGHVIYLIRFCGFWLVVLLLLLFAQARSGRWSKATFRRLGMD